MRNDYLGTRLSTKEAQLLLSLVLSQGTETTLDRAKFARLEEAHLVAIITQKESTHEEAGKEVVVSLVTRPDSGLVLEPSVPKDNEAVGGREKLIQRCQLADESRVRENQIDALIDVWDVAFPEADYPYQRLPVSTAKKFLANGRLAEEIAEIIFKAGEREPKIAWPHSYVKVALEAQDKRRVALAEGTTRVEEPIITDELMNLARLGRQQDEKNTSYLRRDL